MKKNLQQQRAGSYGWLVVGAAFIGLTFGCATIPLYTIGVFVKPLHAAFGWPRSAILLAQLIFIHVLLLSSILGGWLVDKTSARTVISCSAVLFGLSVMAMFFLRSDIRWLYLGYAVMAMCGCCTLPVALSKVVARWFTHRRGLAFGIMQSGVGLGAAALPYATALAIERVGWRDAYLMLGGAVLVIAAPILVCIIRDDPRDFRALSNRHEPQTRTDAIFADGMTFRAAWSSRTFWLLLVAVVLLGGACGGVIPHIPPMLSDQGRQPQAAALALSVAGVATIIGRVLMGYLMDYFFAATLGILFSIPAIFAIPLLARGLPAPAVALCAAAVGLALGMEGDLLAYLCSRYFGLKSYGRIYGVLFGAYLVGAAWGTLLLAQVYDRTGNYTLGTDLLAAAIFVSCILLSRLPRYSHLGSTLRPTPALSR